MSLLKKAHEVYSDEGIISLIKKSVRYVHRDILLKLPIFHRFRSSNSYPSSYEELNELSDSEILGIIQHESHRIEKAVYNDILIDKEGYYAQKRERVEVAINVLLDRGFSEEFPTICWAQKICSMINSEPEYIENNSTPAPGYDIEGLNEFHSFVKTRRSTRVWADEQPKKSELREIAESLIDSAKWAPNSGNRQAWRFKVILDQSEKLLLSEIKEEHTISAPLLIFIGMDKRLYGDVADSETGIYIDAGAAIMQMVLTAHNAGLGTCWNHFGRDLIKTRESNQQAYSEFCNELDIPEHIEPIAILCVGRPEFIPPEPVRVPQEYLRI